MRRVYGFVEDGEIKAIGDDLDEVVGVARQGGGEVLVMDGKEVRSNGTDDVELPGTVVGAMMAANLPAITKAEVDNMSIDEAHRRLRALGIVGATPAAMARGFIKVNAKLAKELTNETVIAGLKKKKAAASVMATRKHALKQLQKAKKNDGICRGVVLLPYHFGKTLSKELGRSLHLPMTGKGLCNNSSPACRDSCLAFSGKNTVENKATKTDNLLPKLRFVEALYHEPVAFVKMLEASIAAHVRACDKKNNQPFVRLNMLSDVPWEAWIPWLFDRFPKVMFYDYTKIPLRAPPKNYDLTLSFSGKNEKQCKEHIAKGGRVALVFVHAFRSKRSPLRTPENAGTVDEWSRTPADKSLARELPETVWGVRVIDGDGTDIRPLDPRGPGVVGLRWKVFQGRNMTFDDDGEPKTNATVLARSIKGKFVYPWYLDEESGWVMAPELPGCHNAGDEDEFA